MSVFNLSSSNTCTAFSGGVTAVTGTGEEWQVTVGGTWVSGDTYTLEFVDSQSGITSQFGAGFVTGVQPIQVMTFNNKVYALGGSSVYFSGVAQPTTFNDPNGTFNGFIGLSDYWATNEALVAMAPYQGRLAFWSNWTIQVFITDPNPLNWIQAQVLPNMGTFAGLSVQSLGDLDVLFLSYTGIRSLRVRDESLYAFINDIGTPIDLLVQANIAGNTAANNALACAVVDPASGRYWLYLNGVIYVLSYYPSSKITAWATYSPTYVSTKDGKTHTATISLFTVFNGQVYARAHSDEGDLILQYGGANNNTYDSTVATLSTSWLDLKSPSTLKKSTGIDVVVNAGLTTATQWGISAGMDYVGGVLEPVWIGQSTLEKGQITFIDDGYLFQIQAVTSGNGPAVLSSLIFEYNEANEK